MKTFVIKVMKLSGWTETVRLKAKSWVWLATTVRFYGEVEMVAEFNATHVLSIQEKDTEVKND